MEKKTYYVSVQAGTVLDDKQAASFEFEILATPEEVDKLAEMFDDTTNVDNHSFWRAHNPTIPYHDDAENDGYDDGLRQIYETIYELGTPETKRHIEDMHLLQH
ncbi:hypothetical protein [Paenibacillus hamazuiensis]|uniref:hypothetical protein n=1 Tax=Paenibacillus hamazuiensis TaxID=2936508 RepID=UPI00200E266B|nr:hypothetical protein [Paenibacillus hamazuiensis]